MRFSLFFLAVVAACAQTAPPVSPSRAPDSIGPGKTIVLVIADDMRKDQLWVLEQTLARLSGAVEFTKATAPAPLCCPSRASILTGQHAHNHGVKSNLYPLGGVTFFPATSTIATWLQDAGWATAYIGKYLNDYGRIAPAVPPGWGHWFVSVGDTGRQNYYDYTASRNGVLESHGSGLADYSTYRFRDETLAWLNGVPYGANALLLFIVEAPHGPYIPAPEDIGYYGSLSITRPPSFNEADVSDKPAWVRALPVMSNAVIAAELANNRTRNEALRALDRSLAALIDSLIAKGRWGSTLFVFTSDHGLAWGEHRLRNKQCAYRTCVDVPLLVRMPGIAARVDSSLVSLIDLAPTFAAWAGVAAPDVDGLDLGPLLSNPAVSWRDAVLIEEWYAAGASFDVNKSFAAVRTHRYLWVEYLNNNYLDRELYDYTVDPWELLNRRTDPAYTADKATLRARLAALRIE